MLKAKLIHHTFLWQTISLIAYLLENKGVHGPHSIDPALPLSVAPTRQHDETKLTHRIFLLQTISLIAYLLENKGVQGPHLIVAPKAVLPNWASEFKTWAPSLSAVLYDGTLDTRRSIQQDPLVSSSVLVHYQFDYCQRV
jgi:hypothetical protein